MQSFRIYARLSLLFPLFFVMSGSAALAEETVRFNRDIRPILTDNCFACHGPDAKAVEGDLRIDLREATTKPDGVIVPGNADESELVRRLFTTDEDELMPPRESHKELSLEQKELLRRWVNQGAEYEPHWAYAPLDRPETPQTATQKSSHAIDRFVIARLNTEGMKPTPPADRITLIRRLSFDLTGMPPTLEEVNSFLNDQSPNAYQNLVDRLLNSKRYGERMAIYWLDLVRYADTVGYHGDQNISQSPYRDYVINAFNANMPYDQFMREQLAGDLLPDPTLQQQIASGYNRLNQTTEEGGAQDKEYLSIYFADRVRNVSQVFMGATMACAQCHDHKYDPYTMRDFYSLGALFADLEEKGKYGGGGRPPEIRVPTDEIKAEIARIDQQIKAEQDQLPALKQSLLPGQGKWEETTRARLAEKREIETVWIQDEQNSGGKVIGNWSFITKKQGPVYAGEKSRQQQSDGLVQHAFYEAKKPLTITENTKLFSWVYLDPKNPPKAIMLQFNDGSWEHRVVWGSDEISYGLKPDSWAGYQRKGELPAKGEWVKLEVDPVQVGLKPDSVVNGMAFTQFGGLAYWDQSGWTSTEQLPIEVTEAIALKQNDRSEAQAKTLTAYYLNSSKPVIQLKQQITDLQTKRKQVEETAPRTVISRATKPRVIRILPRGNWLDESGEIVQPAIPAFLGQLETGDRRATRLDFANWLGSSENLLTSRTMVNRIWFLLFGRGICSSVDDFGGQGTYPSYPDLLDWLAVEFVESGWDIKHLIRLIVSTETYQRSSNPSPQMREQDPYNDLFARQGRFRIEAEMVRDSSLAISGLLVEKVGGVSTKPYQPAGYYAQLNFPRRVYKADTGESQYRRGVYTHWQRTFLHPMLKAFDAPSREECTAMRSRSNTPLQALTLLNDPSFVEAARVFASRIIREGGATSKQRINWAYQTTVSRSPDPAVAAEIQKVYDQHLAYYQSHKTEAEKLIAAGDAPVDKQPDPAKLAAWTSVARIIFNLHEAIMRY